jgi:hypothetical protein
MGNWRQDLSGVFSQGTVREALGTWDVTGSSLQQGSRDSFLFRSIMHYHRTLSQLLEHQLFGHEVLYHNQRSYGITTWLYLLLQRGTG